MSSKMFLEFPPSTKSEWLAAVARELDDESKIARLQWRTAEGFTVEPIAFKEDLQAVQHMFGLPGQAPYTRGVPARTWENMPLLASTTLIDAVDEIGKLGSLGFTSAFVRVSTVRHSEFAEHPLHLETADALRSLFAAAAASGVSLSVDAAECFLPVLAVAVEWGSSVSVICDPWTTCAFTGSTPLPDSTLTAVIDTFLPAPGPGKNVPRVFGVHADLLHDAGAHAVQELGCALACGVEWIRQLDATGRNADDVAQRLRFRFAVGTNFFMDVAKLRAARMLWAKILHHCGAVDLLSGAMDIHAVTSFRSMTRFDPWVNIIRGTVATAVAGIAGVSSVTALPHDVVNGPPSSFSARVARNIQTVLDAETGIGHVEDPAGGSYYVEALTQKVAEHAWTYFQDIERDGGYLAAVRDGSIGGAIRKSDAAQRKLVSTRRAKIIGTNQYPQLGETVRNTDTSVAQEQTMPPEGDLSSGLWRDSSLASELQNALASGASFGSVCAGLLRAYPPVHPSASFVRLHRSRPAEIFERLRCAVQDEATAPTVFLAGFGPGFWRRARATFSSGFFGTAGFRVIDGSDHSSVEEATAAACMSGAAIVVACSADEDYDSGVPILAHGVKQANPHSLVIVAGKPQESEPAFRAAGVDGFIHMESDAGAVLEDIITRLGIPLAEEVS